MAWLSLILLVSIWKLMINTILVEDDSRLAGNIIDFLELENITCDYANNGETALNLIEKNQYQVIILDVNLPRLDGFSVCVNDFALKESQFRSLC